MNHELMIVLMVTIMMRVMTKEKKEKRNALPFFLIPAVLHQPAIKSNRYGKKTPDNDVIKKSNKENAKQL